MMKISRLYIIFVMFFLIAYPQPETLSRKIIKAYRHMNYRRVMKLTGKSIKENQDIIVSRFYAALVFFLKGYDEIGMQWFFSALDDSIRNIRKKKHIVSAIIPEYRALALRDSTGAATALWFLAILSGNKQEADAIFPRTSVHLADRMMPGKWCAITKSLCKYAVVFCARHRDRERSYLFYDVLSGCYPADAPSYRVVNDLLAAEPFFLKSLDIMKQLPQPDKRYEYSTFLYTIAVFYESLGNDRKAESFFIQSLYNFQLFLKYNFVTLSIKEKEKIIDIISPRFQHFFSFLEKRLIEKPTLAGKATHIRLFQKAVIYRSEKKIRERIRQSGDTQLYSDFTKWLTLRGKINRANELPETRRSDLSADMEEWGKQASRLERKLSSRSEEFRLAYEQREYTWQDIRDALEPGEAAVEMVRYRVYDRGWTDNIHYAVIIIKPESEQPEFLFLENGHILEKEIIHLYRNFMRETAYNTFALHDKQTYTLLYNHLWQPLAGSLKDVRRLYFSPDGIYHFINPSSLKDESNRWLWERWDIRRITALQDIPEKYRHPLEVSGNSPVLVGCPVFDLDEEKQKSIVKEFISHTGTPDYESITYRYAGALQQLPGSGEEVKAIAQLFREKGRTPMIWLGEAALEECIKRVKSPTVLHLATHAFFQEDVKTRDQLQFMGMETDRMAEDPLLRSGLLLTGAARILHGQQSPVDLENGVLTAREAADLNLDNTELVVLSACDTGLGEVKNGEGVYGLQRAFLVAGARAVLMSLWKVDDEAARDFMISFYSKWLSGFEKRDAYDQAVKSMKNNYPAPFYWGAFILVGAE